MSEAPEAPAVRANTAPPPSGAPTTRIDIAGAALAADPWPALAALRAQGPLVWHETFGRWLVTTDREIRKVLSNFGRFTVEGTTIEVLFGADAFIAMDDRRAHDRLRNVWVDAFRKQHLDGFRATIDRLVDRLLAPVVAALRDGEAVDISDAVCRSLPTLVIAGLMAIPDEAIPDVVRWSDAIAAGGATYLPPDEAERLGIVREEAKAALGGYLVDLLRERRARPGDDLVSQLSVSEPGLALPDDVLVPNLRQLLFAGNETTAKWLAQLFVTYGELPALQRELAADPGLIGAANDEVMRCFPPTGTLVRRVRGGPIVLAGVELADGDALTLLLASANRDPARYDDPDRFDIHRPALPNLGFGVGFHSCLGLVLAKIEAETAVARFLEAVPAFDIVRPYAFSSLPLRGPLPVVVAAAR